MTWRFYACVVIALIYGSAVAWIKMDARRRIREGAEMKAAAEALKNAPPRPEWPPQASHEPLDPWGSTTGPPVRKFSIPPEVERRIKGLG